MHQRQGNQETLLSVFISYAHEDEVLRQKLETHLSLLRRQSLISEWHDREVLPGAEWGREIDEHLEVASIILLLISPDFLASDYCYDIEMKHALERHQRGEARVIPVILRPCDWQTSPFAPLQSLPLDGKAVTTWQNLDEAFLTIAQGLRRVIERQQIPARPLSRVRQQNRTRLLKRVRATWIEGVLEHSLHQAVLIALDLQEQPEALANPWQLEVQETNVPPHLLPAGTPLVQVYDEAEGELLILGESGAGKTTLLLHLTSDLLKRAEQENTFPMPVVFTLSSWAEKRPSLPDWFIEELFTKYQVPRNLGRSWVENDQLLPLLDGLDEVTQVHRSACIQVINTYRQEHNLVPIVLCSRKAEYEVQSARITLSKAVVIQSLTSQQIDDYLTQAGQRLEAVRLVLHEDQELQELARTPLMLTILALAYQGKAVEDLVTRLPPDAQRRHVFGTYVERMLQRRGASRYPPEQMRHWLSWLARQMIQHGQAEFYLEQLQPDWLSENRLHRFHRVGVELLCGLIGMLLFGLVFGLLGGYVAVSGGPEEFVSWRYGLGLGLFVGSVSWWVYLTSSMWTEIKLADYLDRSWWNIHLYSAEFLLDGLVVGLLGGLGLGLVAGQSLGLEFGLYFGLGYLLWSMLVSVDNRQSRLSRLIRQRWTEIKPAEVVNWSWASMQRNFWKGLTLPIVFGLFLGLGYTWAGGDLGGAFILGLLAWMAGAVPIGLASGWSHEVLSEHHRLTPNQGIWLSARNGVLAGLAYGLCLGLVFGLITGLFGGLVLGLVVGLITGLGLGLIFGLSSGGIAYMQHVVLRLLLWYAGSVPWDYPRFLDYTTERVLLRKVGGGYSFVHRLLLDYFASLEKKES